MTRSLRSLVSDRAGHRCEYCRLHEADLPRYPFHLEHVIPRKHGGGHAPGNLAWSCQLCNLFKGSNLSGLDPRSGKIARLYNPRRQKWSRHFAWNGLWIVGKTATGRSYYPSAANEFAPSSPDALIPHSSGVISGRIIEQISPPGT